MEINLKESLHFGSENKGVDCRTPTYDIHLVLPDGTIKRCQINKNRQFNFFQYTWLWNEHQTKIIGVKSAVLKHEFVEAGFRYLKDMYEDEGNEDGYEAYRRWEATCDKIGNRSAEFKREAIPDITPHLPVAVQKLQRSKQKDLDFGLPKLTKEQIAAKLSGFDSSLLGEEDLLEEDN